MAGHHLQYNILSRKLLLLLLSFAVAINPRGQKNAALKDYHEIYRQAEHWYNDPNANAVTDSLALSGYKEVIGLLSGKEKNDSLLFESYLKCGILFTGQNASANAIIHFKGAIQTVDQSAGLNKSLSFLPWIYAGSNYYDLYQPDSALACYDSAEHLLNVYPGLDEAERLYNKKGVLFYETGDLSKCIPYFSKALSLVDSTDPSARYFIVNYKNNLASAYRKLQQYDKALGLYTSLLPFHINTAELLHNIGVTCLDAGRYTEAVYYLQKVPYNNALKYNDLATCYLQLNQTDSAGFFINAALGSRYKSVASNKAVYANTLKLNGDLLMAQHKAMTAIHQYHQAMLALYPPYKDTMVTSNPVQFRGMYRFYLLFDLLAAKAGAFESIKEAKTIQLTSLKNANAAYRSAVLLSHYMERIYGSDESRLFLKNKVDEVYRQAVENALELFELTGDTAYRNQAFAEIEDNKASVLQTGIRLLELSSVKGMPAELLHNERMLKSTLAALNIRMDNDADSNHRTALQQQVLDAELKLSGVQQQLDHIPAYQRLKNTGQHISLGNLQQNITGEDQLVLSYYNTGKQLVCFYAGRQALGYLRLPSSPEEITAQIKRLRRLLVSPDGGDNNTVQALTGQLYSELLQPLADLLKTVKRLVIVPYNELGYVPFEMLRSPVTGRNVLEDFAVSYQYSANFIAASAPAANQYQVLAMAPFNEAPDAVGELPQLSASMQEIKGLPGKTYTGSLATKSTFVQAASSYPVIHLATHAKVNDSFPGKSFIAFYDRSRLPDSITHLYEQEIYHLDLSSTKLAILSACETGDGQLVNGEGVMSLSRAFSYAGCKTVVTSLWKADDKATAYISERLHHYLQKGLAADESLQKAKRDYLKDDNIPQRYKKPAYWANLVLSGSPAAVVSKPVNWFVISAILLSLLVVMIVMKKSRARS